MPSANQVLSAFIAAGQVWYVALPDKRPALLTDVGLSDDGLDGVCLFQGRQQALDFLWGANVLPGRFKPRRGAPHPRRPEGVGAFVRACRRYSDFLCLPWPAAGGQRFDFFFLEIKQLLASAQQAGPSAGRQHARDDPPTEQGWQFRFDYRWLRFSGN